MHTQWQVEGVGNAYIVVVPGDAVAGVGVADEAVLDGVVEDDAGPAIDDVEGVGVTHRNEARVGSCDYIREQVADSVSPFGFGLVAKLSHLGSGDLEQGLVEGVEGRVRYTHLVEDTSAGRALEGEGKCSDVHRSYMPGH